MITTQSQTRVKIASEVESTEVKRKGKFLFFFDTEWWETINTNVIGNDLHIKTNHEIRNIYINGELKP